MKKHYHLHKQTKDETLPYVEQETKEKKHYCSIVFFCMFVCLIEILCLFEGKSRVNRIIMISKTGK